VGPSALKKLARMTGFWYLLWALSGIYGMLIVPPQIFVPGDAAATGVNMLAHEVLFKTLTINGVVTTVLTVVLLMALYRLFEQVNERRAKYMVALIILVVPAGLALDAFSIAALMIFKGEVLTTFDIAQRQDLAMLCLKMSDYAAISFTAFWGLWLFPLAALVYKSRFLPRFLGVWLAINGVAYLAQSFTSLLLPSYRSLVFNLSWPAMLGELAFTLWLLVMGANVTGLKEQGDPPEE